MKPLSLSEPEAGPLPVRSSPRGINASGTPAATSAIPRGERGEGVDPFRESILRNTLNVLFALTLTLSHPTRRAVAPSQRVGYNCWVLHNA